MRSAPMSTCRNCGSDVAADARFCSRCGEQLVGPDPTAPIPPAPAATRGADRIAPAPAATRGAGVAEAGRSCPYCRFPIKPGGAMRVCEICGATHHLDCWTDNGGCAVVGCAAGPGARPAAAAGERTAAAAAERPAAAGTLAHDAGAAMPPTRLQEHPGAPPGSAASRRRRPRSVPLGAAALAVGIVALAGVAATVLAGGSSGRHSDSGGRQRTQATGRAGASAHTATESGGGASSSAAPASHGGQESSASAAAKAPAPERAPESAPESAPAAGMTRYRQQSFSVEVPSGWVQEENEVVKPAEVENTWHQPGGSEPYVLIDVHAPTHLTPQQDAEPVHRTLEEAVGYRQIYYGEGDLTGHTAWMWIFENEGSERIDYFFETCANSIAVLGVASPESFGTLRGTFRTVAQSVRSNCE